MGNLRFADKIVIVTGATSGIGAETAREFAEEGAEVLLLGRSEERGAIIEKQIREKGGKAVFLSCDVRTEESVKQVRQEIEKRYSGIDVLFNNAGVFLTSALQDITADDWKKSFETNVDGVLYMTRYFMDMLVKSRGTIINNASVSGLQSCTSGTKNYMYGASKAAMIKFSKLCALNYAEHVRVNCICPGIIDTEIYSNRDFSRFDGAIPMGYIGMPKDVAKVVLFLASEEASYITGAVIPIDGGMSLQ